MAHYYVLIHPIEALVASSLEASAFGTYMATGAKQGSAEQLMFVELSGGGFGADFEWERAQRECDQPDDIKHSCYLSIYRVLERVPLDRFGRLYLVTQDGRNLGLDPEETIPPHPHGTEAYLYQELAPVQALAVSRLDPAAFLDYLLGPAGHLSLPALALTRLHLPEQVQDDDSHFDQRRLSHLHYCSGLLSDKEKPMKIVDRTAGRHLAYRHVIDGFFFGRGELRRFYAMPTPEEIAERYYQWGRSAHIL